ncbi:hypothetical protein H6F47_22415 [Sphaerospermopsis sp. FACHB-1094]|uniref:hypothetical protein n=1 Tax=Sphaerospermopsis sp. FACHB-1094 TaxID=2692861 RepID=UPI00168319D7|nr:hypothetical protein [Sphaerospermopsis sp. FACHB-1094]MBD2135094.1 hypothetical protein [Sphaerospermopsis sp. FACHB-1094]
MTNYKPKQPTQMNQQNLQTKYNTNSVWEDLVISILSVNQYTLSKTYANTESMREIGLFNPENLKQWDIQEMNQRLRQGGCERGSFMTNLFAERLTALGILIANQGINNCEKILSSRDKKLITDFLMPVKGIGPKVIQNFFLLQEL